jgi:hypothetical protein
MQCLPITGVTTADEKVAKTRDALVQRMGGYRNLVLAYARANLRPAQGWPWVHVNRPGRFSFTAEHAASEYGVYLIFEVFDRLQNR